MDIDLTQNSLEVARYFLEHEKTRIHSSEPDLPDHLKDKSWLDICIEGAKILEENGTLWK